MQPGGDYIKTARDLVGPGRGRPRQTNLRRAVSTAYYALFHCLAACCADTLVGGDGANRSEQAWRQTYRALDHGLARQRCEQATGSRFPDPRFPPEVLQFATLFVSMQKERHSSDYDPYQDLSKASVMQSINAAEDAMTQFLKAPDKDRRAFAVYVLLPLRKD